MSIEAMKQALEALETLNSGDTYKTHNAATALRAAIEQAEKREWQGLTNEEVGKLIPNYVGDSSGIDLYWLITEIEAKLKEKNT